jgi:hypothetical protein
MEGAASSCASRRGGTRERCEGAYAGDSGGAEQEAGAGNGASLVVGSFGRIHADDATKRPGCGGLSGDRAHSRASRVRPAIRPRS